MWNICWIYWTRFYPLTIYKLEDISSVQEINDKKNTYEKNSDAFLKKPFFYSAVDFFLSLFKTK